MSQSKGRHYEGAQGATGTASVPEVAVQCRRNLSSVMVTTQHGSSQYILHDMRWPKSLIFRSSPLPPDPFPAALRPSVSLLVTGGYTRLYIHLMQCWTITDRLPIHRLSLCERRNAVTVNCFSWNFYYIIGKLILHWEKCLIFVTIIHGKIITFLLIFIYLFYD